MLRATGMCNGIENYSRHFDGRVAGQPAATLLHYFPDDFLMVVDESHVAMPQAGGMYRGDRARKQTLIEHGFRLPSAIDNRPLKFDEFRGLLQQVLFVSATPGAYELDQSDGRIVELVVRPTGLVDPLVEVRPAKGQVDDVVDEVRIRTEKKERVLITTLTKRSAEELTDYLRDLGIKVRYLHSDIDSIERTALIRDLRLGVFDVLVGINLLREGLDIPEVTLVAVLDADKEGYLRSKTSLIQTSGRAARNADGRVILYADKRTDSIDGAIGEMERRRQKQILHNEEHGITPRTIVKPVRELLDLSAGDLDEADGGRGKGKKSKKGKGKGKKGRGKQQGQQEVGPVEHRRQFESHQDLVRHVKQLRQQMITAAKDLDFELAAQIRDEVYRLEQADMELL